jgi:excisionase family DNA binding protein
MAPTTHGIDAKSPVPISAEDQKDVQKLYEAIRRGRAKLVGPDGESRQLPDSLYAFWVELIGVLQQGKSVHILQNQSRLTTAEVASLLGVSRQFLVNLLEAGEIAYHKVGSHRRIYVKDLVKFRVKRDLQRKKILSEI